MSGSEKYVVGAPFGPKSLGGVVIVLGGPSRGAWASAAPGTVAEVVYAGPVTRFVVDLDGGGRLIALEGNGHQARHDEVGRGDRVELVWHREHLIEVPEGEPAPNSSADDSSIPQRSPQ